MSYISLVDKSEKLSVTLSLTLFSLPGTKEERGLLKWKQMENADTGEAKTCSGLATEETYSFPCFSRRSLPRWITALPFLPPVNKDPPANINEV